MGQSCAGIWDPGLEVLTLGNMTPWSTVNKHKELSPRFSPGPRQRGRAAWVHGPVWEAGAKHLGHCICNHGNNTGGKERTWGWLPDIAGNVGLLFCAKRGRDTASHSDRLTGLTFPVSSVALGKGGHWRKGHRSSGGGNCQGVGREWPAG